MIKVTYIPKDYTIKLSGHSGAGTRGNDIVCSACSMVYYNLVAVLNLYPIEEAYKCFRGQEGTDGKRLTFIKARPKKEYAELVEHDFSYAMVGFQTLADNYPECIKIEIK